MDTSQKTIPNAIEITEEVSNKIRENQDTQQIKKEIQELKEKVMEVIQENNKIKRDLWNGDAFEPSKEKKEGKRKDSNEGDSFLVRWIHRISIFAFTCVASFWVYGTMVAYGEETIYTTTNVMQSDTFLWPTLTVAPGPNFLCYNKTTFEELKKTTNIGIQKKWGLPPFDVNVTNFDWKTNNVSNIYVTTKIQPPYVVSCTYTSATLNESNCLTGNMGKWETYNGQYETRQSYTPPAATSLTDEVSITINTGDCSYWTVTVHPRYDRYYSTLPPKEGKIFRMRSGLSTVGNLKVEESHRLSTSSSPCIQDVQYSKAQCHEDMRVQYKIKSSGCYFPGITGYQQKWASIYPECNTSRLYHKFMALHSDLYLGEDHHEELLKIKNKCGDNCKTKVYLEDRKTRPTYVRQLKPYSVFTMRMDKAAMAYKRITEKRAMTLEMLVADVGGILGLFLGISFVSVVGNIKSLIRKVGKTIELWHQFHGNA